LVLGLLGVAKWVGVEVHFCFDFCKMALLDFEQGEEE
jgi:hypothetical protein